ncbi:MAG: aspartate aminotransferase family protein, partial [Anaerolineae bacterium]|nr:aspartate aminotransferase family protein [Anaerolineae bacterium]
LRRVGVFDQIAGRTKQLTDGICHVMAEFEVPIQVGQVGAMFGFYFLKQPGAIIRDYASAKQYADTDRFAQFFHAMLEQGVYLAPSQFEAGFLSSAHTDEDIQFTLNAVRKALQQILS